MRQDPTKQIRGAFTRDLEAVLRTARGQAVQRVRDALRKGALDVDELNRMVTQINDNFVKSEFEKVVSRHTGQAYRHGVGWTLAHVDAAPKPPGTPALNISLDLARPDLKAIDNITTLAYHDLKDLNVNLSKQLMRDLAKADKQGLGVVKMAEIINARYGVGMSRAVTIARTTTTLAYNSAAHDRITEYAPYKEWIATMSDSRTRQSHKDVHHVVIPSDEPFHLPAYTPEGGRKAVPAGDVMFPGDDSLGADLSQIINCRCTVGPRFTRRP